MSSKTRSTFTAEFKGKVAIAALKGDKTINELSQMYQVHPSQIAKWKKELQSNAASVFNSVSLRQDSSTFKIQHDLMRLFSINRSYDECFTGFNHRSRAVPVLATTAQPSQ